MKKLLCLILLVTSQAFAATGNNQTAVHPPVAPSSTIGGDTATTVLGTLAAKAGGCFPVDIDGSSITITHAGHKISATTGTPAADSYKISLQAPGSDGNPSGTVLGGGSPASSNVTPSGSGWQWEALDNSYTANRGDIICVVTERLAATDAANKIELAYRNSIIGTATNMPYGGTNDGATWTKSPRMPIFAVKNTDASVVVGFPLATLENAQTFGNTVEEGESFTLPTSFCSTYTVKAVEWSGNGPTAGANTYQVRIYSTPTGTPSMVQETGALDSDALGQSATAGPFYAVFTGTLATLNCGTKYGVAFSTTTATNMSLYYMSVANVADWNAWPGQQQTARISRTNASYPPASSATSFTETTTTRPRIKLIIGDITAPAGGGTAVGGVF